MKRFAYILLMTLVSCTVFEDRSVCPSDLCLIITKQSGHIYQDGLAWCGIYAPDGSRLEGSPLEGMNGRDTALLYSVPRKMMSAVASSREAVSGCVVAGAGRDMEEMYACRLDIDCSGEYAEGMIDHVDRQFCNLTVILAEDAIPFASGMGLLVKAPYDGSVLPSLEPHKGDFRYNKSFDGLASAEVRLPRQGGSGLVLCLVTDTFTASCDLYGVMTEASYDWEAPSLDDFTVTVSINRVAGVIEVLDWEVEELGDWEF